jgi:hypothetical protein
LTDFRTQPIPAQFRSTSQRGEITNDAAKPENNRTEDHPKVRLL